MVRMMIERATQALPVRPPASDPFDGRLEVPVAGGTLNVAYAGPAPGDADAVVLAVHGISSSHVTWRTVARRLAAHTRTCLIAPDLRGRGRSAGLPGPYGLSRHIDDLAAVLDDVDVEQAVMVGHSMGAHVAARLCADHPERSAGLVLVDGGLPCPAPVQECDGAGDASDPTCGRMETPAASADEYLAGWRAHPAFTDAWDEDVDAYARYDMADDGRAVRCAVREESVTADCFDLVFDGVTRKALTRVQVPVRLLRAPRGPFDDDCPTIPRAYLDGFVARHPHVHVEHVPETNHYTILLGKGPGPARVAAAIEAAIRAAEWSPAR